MTIGILSTRNMDSAPRIIREVFTLEKDFELILIGNSSQLGNHKIHPIYSFRGLYDKIISRFDNILKRRRVRYSKLNKFIIQKQISLVIIHEPEFIPLAIQLKEKHKVKIIFNAHEYHPLEFDNDPKWLSKEGVYYSKLYREKLQKFDLFINVCESIRKKCIEEFQVDSIVIPNAAFESKLPPSKTTQFPIRLIHHGTILPGRKIEKMISIVEQAGIHFSLDIMGVPNPHAMDYFNKIKDLCSQTNNIRLIPPVKFNEIVPHINQYDCGIYLLEPSNFNNFNALPNKLFEFIQAKLAIIVSPSPEMSQIVSHYNIGQVASNFSID